MTDYVFFNIYNVSYIEFNYNINANNYTFCNYLHLKYTNWN